MDLRDIDTKAKITYRGRLYVIILRLLKWARARVRKRKKRKREKKEGRKKGKTKATALMCKIG